LHPPRFSIQKFFAAPAARFFFSKKKPLLT
jgi:hypothetical protein